MTKSLIFLLMLTFLGAIPPKGRCLCQPASEEDVPQGANESIEYSEQTLKSIYGKVLFPTDEPVEEAVVEVYDYTDADKKLDSYHLVRSKDRRTACLTDKDGSFCFTGLPSGRYLLRAGTRTRGGMNEVYVKVKLDKSWWKVWRFQKGMNLTLTPGT